MARLKSNYSFYLSLLIHGHVHPDQSLVRLPLRTVFAEPQRRVDVAEHLHDVGVVELTTGENIRNGNRVRLLVCGLVKFQSAVA